MNQSSNPTAESAAIPPQRVFGHIESEILVVLSAAVAAVLRNEHRIVAVSVSTSMSSTDPTLLWSLEGRRQIYSSHRLR